MSTTKQGFSKVVLTKSTKDGTAFVSFRVLRDNRVRVYSYGTWTDYTVDYNETRPAARAVWSRLVSEGWTVLADDRCAFLSSRVACEAA